MAFGKVRNFKSTHDVLCDACSLRLEKLRADLDFYREENCRLISQLYSVFGRKKFAELDTVPPDKAVALPGFHSLSSLSDHLAAAAMHSFLPEAFHSREDFILALASFSLKVQIASTEKEWKSLAVRYNELVEQIQWSEKMLADVENRNFYLELENAKLLSMMPYEQRSLEVLLNQVMDDQASSTNSVAQLPSEHMNEKSPEIWKNSVYTSPLCSSEQKMSTTCSGNNSGPLYSPPISVLGEIFHNDEGFEDSVGAAYKSPAYTLKGRTCSIKSREGMCMYGHAGGEDDQYQRSVLLHAPMALPLARGIHPPDEAVTTKCISALPSETDECFIDALAVDSSRKPPDDLQFLNSVRVVSKRQLTSIFDASLLSSEKERCNQWSPRTSSSKSSFSKS